MRIGWYWLLRTVTLGGTAIYEKRSCMLGKLGKQIGASHLNIYDDPHLFRGLASRPYDGDGFPTEKRSIIEDGRLSMYLISLYNSRRLEMDRTTTSTSNILIPPSESSPQELLNALPKAIVVEGFSEEIQMQSPVIFSGITGRYLGQLSCDIRNDISGNI